MLCTIAIPTRLRPAKLRQCVQSVFRASSGHYDRFEVLIRVHRSDSATTAFLPDLEASLMPGQHFRVIWGDDFYGYLSLAAYYVEMIEASLGEWVWHINDDMQIFNPERGPGWDDVLDEHAWKDCLIQPEHHKLNTSMYHETENGPAPCHRRDTQGLIGELKRAAEEKNPEVDILIHDHIMQALNRPVFYLKGIGIWHDWDGLESHVA